MARTESAHPVTFELNRKEGLAIRWSDGMEAMIPLPVLRRVCPCATCRAEREARRLNPLHVLRGPAGGEDSVIVASAELAGNYALRVTWRDGHDTGIYDFGLLRVLSERATNTQT